MKISFSAFNIFVLSANLSLVAAGVPSEQRELLRAETTENEGRIAGGSEANVGQFPYYVDLWDCGGILISPTVVLTAAHCEDRTGQYVLVGAQEYQTETDTAEFIKVVEYVEHEHYDDYTYENDIALLRLEKPYYMDNNFQLNIAANQWAEKFQFGGMLTVAGLGWIDYDKEEDPTHLQHVEIPFIDWDTCNSPEVWDGEVIEDQMFCAGTDGKNACDGDSGGPIVRINHNNEHTLVGLVSWGGESCDNANEPIVYVRVSAFHDWINSIICDEWSTEGGLCNPFDFRSNWGWKYGW